MFGSLTLVVDEGQRTSHLVEAYETNCGRCKSNLIDWLIGSSLTCHQVVHDEPVHVRPLYVHVVQFLHPLLPGDVFCLFSITHHWDAGGANDQRTGEQGCHSSATGCNCTSRDVTTGGLQPCNTQVTTRGTHTSNTHATQRQLTTQPRTPYSCSRVWIRSQGCGRAAALPKQTHFLSVSRQGGGWGGRWLDSPCREAPGRCFLLGVRRRWRWGAGSRCCRCFGVRFHTGSRRRRHSRATGG